MSLRAYANKRDSSEPSIIEVLEKAGCKVKRIDEPVDLLVKYRGALRLVEVKTGKGRLTKRQKDFIEEGWPVNVIRDVDEALLVLRLWNNLEGKA